MARKGITVYDLLISCPSDVSNYVEILKESVESFNRVFGALNNIEVAIKHWSTDSFPESGDKPQELLNKQFVRDCDVAVAIFWTRFGTPTDNYGSGTEEEIEEMLSADKQVFMYFLDEPINPSEVDVKQYQKVLDFREKYKDRGVYAVVTNKNDFQRQFTNHLSLYFLSLISGGLYETNEILKPFLKIRDVNTLSDEYYSFNKKNLLESKFINKKKEEIIENIDKLKKFFLPKIQNEESTLIEDNFQKKSNTYTNMQIPKLDEDINSIIGTTKLVKFNDNWIKTINDFANKNKINLDEDFWNLGNLQRYNFSFKIPFGNYSHSYKGTDEEKKRYSLIKDLYWNIQEYNEYNKYFEFIDSIVLVELMISNLGKSYDEDIDIKLLVPNGCLIKHYDLPYPEINIIEELLDKNFIEKIFSIKESENVSRYENYQSSQQVFRKVNNLYPIFEKSISEEYEENKNNYKDSLDSLFLYKEFKNSEFDILMFGIKYLKHNSSKAFPSVLMFKKIPQTIDYEIKSKHISEVIRGKLKLKN